MWKRGKNNRYILHINTVNEPNYAMKIVFQGKTFEDLNPSFHIWGVLVISSC